MDRGRRQLYSMALGEGEYAAAIFTQRPEQAEIGIPPCWTNRVDGQNALYVVLRDDENR